MTDEANVGESLGDFIRRHRKGRGFTQGQLAELVGVSQVTISDWELGGSTPSKGRELAEALGIDRERLAWMMASQVLGDDEVVQAIRQSRLEPKVRDALITIYEQAVKAAS